MQPFAAPETETDASHDNLEPMLMVSMLDDHLVLSTPRLLDLETTKVLVIAAASAVASGSTVMIDLDPDTASDELVARRPLGVAVNCIARADGPVEVLGAGYVRLTTRDAHWTIDLAHGRLCRSDDVIEPHFVAPGAWTPIQALWVSPTNVTALTNSGTYLSTLAAWTADHHVKRPAPA